ncbi:translation initiation factor IF-2 [Candidatus Phycorickettsia trachydisci]|uniref:Translation initiation factor IF-2 n=1 Tax=Candidatus Phycorickettsia trachydisci TaxID=2115978 RepID=A0A2P1P6V8_9RICK|nr:translation initiation factor IF-2 [Candidatus Phycorickettsia trachydisci]AVP86996.1 translation initiation factor IF-2 [Candidatus Phycorickettsia trachydisci]
MTNKKPLKLGLRLGNISTEGLAKDYADLKASSNLLKKTPATPSMESAKESHLTDQELIKRFDVLKKASQFSEEDELLESSKAREIFKANFIKETEEEVVPEIILQEASSPQPAAATPKPPEYKSVEESEEAPAKSPSVKTKFKKNLKEKHKRKIEFDLEEESEQTFHKSKRHKSHNKQQAKPQEKIIKEVELYGSITAAELANKMSEKVSDVIKTLISLGMIADANKTLDLDTAELVVEALGHKFKRVEAITVDSILKGEIDSTEDLKPRPPVVTVMGHVDHGKTSLLDAIRSTDVAGKEHGGITQSIGAYQVKLPNGRKITLIDTPGHEAFTEMRSRGAQITDIVILIVAADDGINHQTVEAINHIKAANLPIIVAVNKIDKVDNVDQAVSRIKNELLIHNLVAEDMGGDVIFVPISALKRINLDKLEESILLLADLLELKTNPDTFGSGVVLDAKIDKHRGIVTSILLTRGALQVGDPIVSGGCYGKVRAIFTHKKESVKSIEPSTPATIIGMESVPRAGDKFVAIENDKQARQIAEQYSHISKEKSIKLAEELRKSTDLFAQDDAKEFAIILKADSGGSIEAITGSLAKINLDKVNLRILHSAVGSVNDSDAVLASASNAPIFAFNTKTTLGPSSNKLQVDIRHYSVIYDLIDDVTNLMKGLVEPTYVKEFIGQANVRQVFEITKVGKIAGSYVTKGMVKRDSYGQLFRGKELLHEGKIKTLKRFKDDVKEVKETFECGIGFEDFSDIQVGDNIEVFIYVEENDKK